MTYCRSSSYRILTYESFRQHTTLILASADPRHVTITCSRNERNVFRAHLAFSTIHPQKSSHWKRCQIEMKWKKESTLPPTAIRLCAYGSRHLRRSDSMELNISIRTNDFLLHDVSTFWNHLIAGALSSPFIPSQGFIANQQLQNVFMKLFLSHHKDFEFCLCVRCLVRWHIIVSYSAPAIFYTVHSHHCVRRLIALFNRTDLTLCRNTTT
ncbi:unnamed protein product [Albugo candida]|uniref:Uncharacterized protein n=1 Tax=Albugo candida TaxID=65357 RepID=A0A024GTK7_9STRA|nr:unnamed protein product [Albugo candida]|eukprot:CCI50044.1 unnamed protein product [Albugo candida]